MGDDLQEFSLVRGGPVYGLMGRLGLSNEAAQPWRRPILVLPLLAWAPLFVLSVLGGTAWGGKVSVPFLKDVNVHVRFLVALPLLVLAETVVQRKLAVIVPELLRLGVIPPESKAKFDAAIGNVRRVRDSMAELVMLAIVYTVFAFYVWPKLGALHVTSWSASPDALGRHLSAAGWWFVAVSLPLFQFMVLRWYFRLFLWNRFLWDVTRLELVLVPTHPDRAGGLAFLGEAGLAFGPLLAAHGAFLAGVIGNKIVFEGARLPEFLTDVVGILLFAALIALGPLFLFAPHLRKCFLAGHRDYGELANRYSREFDAKWVRGGAPAGEPLLGSGDIQSLADMGNSFTIVEEMSLVPFGKRNILRIVAVTLLPLAPLLLTMFSIKELLTKLLTTVF